MIKYSIVFLLSTLFFSCSFNNNKEADERGYIVKVGDTAPDFMIREAEGNSYKLSDLRGKVVMLQFTASWCSVCRTEMPFIESEIWQEKKSGEFALIGIDRDEPAETVLQFKRHISVSYPLALDPGANIFSLYAEKDARVTRNVVIGRSGKIIFLSRLFEREEFESMKKVIFTELDAK